MLLRINEKKLGGSYCLKKQLKSQWTVIKRMI